MPPVAVSEFQDALGELAARSGEATDKLLARISALSPTEARAFITDAYPTLLAPYLSASSELSLQWYAEQPGPPVVAGSAPFVPEAAPMRSGDQLAISGRWALTQSSPTTALRGNATRQVLNQSRDTVVYNAERENVRWVRQAKLNACGFCKMLATRAAKDLAQYSYKSEGVRRKLDRYGNPTGDYTLVVIGKRGIKRRQGGRSLGSEYHDHCRCTAVPIRDGSYEPPDYVQAWTDEYDAIVKEYGTGDLLKISNLMDAGRVRPERIFTSLMDGQPDLFTTVATAQPAPPTNLDASTAQPPAPDVVAQLDAGDLTSTEATQATADLSELDQTIADAMAALENGDEALAGTLFDRAEKLETAQKAKAARKAAKQAAADADRAAKYDRVGELIDQGYTPAQAEAEVFNVSVESIWRRDFILQARSDGHQGAGFDELLTSVHKGMVEEWFWKAEAEVSVMIKSRYIGKFDPMKLWSVNEATARKVMSEEMAAWFDANGGRITRSVYRDSVLSDADAFDTNMTSDFLQ